MNSETTTDQPPTLPDAVAEWHEVPRDHIVSLGERVRCEFNDELDTATELTVADDVTRSVQAAFSRYGGSARGTTRFYSTTPPPAPSEPWSVISTDRDKPTLARVTWVGHGGVTGTFAAEVYLNGEDVEFADGHVGKFAVSRDFVTHVELLHTCPETHVPVERALIDEVKSLLGEMQQYTMLTDVDRTRLYGAETALAALASDESSDTDGGRS